MHNPKFSARDLRDKMVNASDDADREMWAARLGTDPRPFSFDGEEGEDDASLDSDDLA